jgi:hypothetical protein
MATTDTTVMMEAAAANPDIAVQAGFIERRRSTRYQFTAAVEVTDLNSLGRMQARTSDLGSGGCFVDATSPFPVNSAVKMRLTKNNRSFEVTGRVAYSMPGMGMGVAFTATAPGQIEVLKRWLGELSGKLVPELTSPALQFREAKGPNGHASQSLVLGHLIMELVQKGILCPEVSRTLLNQLVGGREQ